MYFSIEIFLTLNDFLEMVEIEHVFFHNGCLNIYLNK